MGEILGLGCTHYPGLREPDAQLPGLFRHLLTAPNVPADRVKALRQAFAEAMRDPQFVEAAKQASMEMNPMQGEELQQVVQQIISSPPHILAMVKDAIAIKDVQGKGQ